MWDWRQLKWLSYAGWWPNPNFSDFGNKILRIVGIILLSNNIFQLIFEIVNLYIAFGSGLSEIILNLTTTTIGLLCNIKTVVLVYYHKEAREAIELLKEMDERVTKLLENEKVEKYSRRREVNCKLFVYYVFLVQGFALIHWMSRPLYFAYLGIKVLLVETYAPWSKTSWFNWGVCFFIQSIHVYSAMHGYVLSDSLLLSMLMMLLLQIDYLKLALKKLDFSLPNADTDKRITLKFCVKFHQDIILMYGKINKLVKHIILLQTVSITIGVCLGIYEGSMVEGTSFVKKMNLAELVFVEVFSVFFFSLVCQELEDSNIEILRSAYKNNWYIGNNKDKQSYVILVEMCKKKINFGFIVFSNLETLIAVIKTSFTYFNFLKAMSEKIGA